MNASGIARTTRLVDASHSVDGRGLEAGVRDEIPIADPVRFTASLGPYATALVSLEPAPAPPQ